MGKKTFLVGSLAATAGLLVAGTPAFADSSDNDGINIGNDNNISVLPIQACGNNVAVLGAVVPILSPQKVQCVNAPIVDHPSVEDGGEKPEKPEKPEQPEKPEKPEKPEGEDKPEKGTEPKPEDDGEEEELPTAPTPEVVTGHAAVTG